MQIGDFLQYAFDRLKAVRPVTHKVGDQEYAVEQNGTLGEPVRALAPQFTKPVFHVSTLSGLAELVKNKVDEFPKEVALHVVSPERVELVSLRADEFGRRHEFARATHEEGAPFEFNEFLDAETFLIAFRRSFLFNDEAVKVVQLCSNLESGQQVSVADDGVSQKLAVASGTVSKAQVTLPAEGIKLIPWRTFRDAAPVASKFLLRLKGTGTGVPKIALYDIDQVWELETMGSIAAWLKKHVTDVPVIA